MEKRITAAALFALCLCFCAFARTYAAQPEAKPAVKADEAVTEGRFKTWWNKWRGKSEEKVGQLIDNREAIANKAGDKGEKMRSTAAKMAAQAEKQSSKGNNNAAAKLKSHADRLGGLGNTVKDASDKVKDKGGDVLKNIGKYVGKNK